MILKIALLQVLPHENPTLEHQFEKGCEACRKAKQLGADIALFPEMWSTGYVIPQDSDELEKRAVSVQSDFVRGFAALSAELSMAIGITFLEKHSAGPRNSFALFDRHGEKILHYSKVHTCAFDAEQVLSGGDGFYTAEVDTGRGIVKVGGMICFDREFPESARILMLKGAEVILAPNACPMEINRLSALRTRAYENMLSVVTCNYPSGQPDCNGKSSVFDGIAWLRDEPYSRDMCVFEAPEDEGVYLSQIDIDALRFYRENEVMGDKFRRPRLYGALCR